MKTPQKILSVICAVLLAVAMTASFSACKNAPTDGLDGKDGTSILWKGSFASAPENPGYLWAYYNTTDGCSYVWDGSKWTLLSGTPKQTYDVQIREMEARLVKFRALENDDVQDSESVYLCFNDRDYDIPYAPISDEFLKFWIKDKYKVSAVDANTTEVTITNTQNKYTVVFDLVHHTVYFENYDAFFQSSDEYYYDPAAATYFDYMQIVAEDTAFIAGNSFTYTWPEGIDICLLKNGNDYIFKMPLATFSDIFMAPSLAPLVYNGTNIYVSSDNKKILEEYYSTSTGQNCGVRSKALADFCYDELCLDFDLNYGLSKIHGIDSFPNFDTYFACIDFKDGLSIKDGLKSTDALTFAKALKDVCSFYFDDGHSNYKHNSHFLGVDGTGKEKEVPATHTSQMNKAYYANMDRYRAARGETEEDGKKKFAPAPAYIVSSDGKTAIVRFDSFTCNGKQRETVQTVSDDDLDVYVHSLEETYDTIALIHTINAKIKANASIENVVLDLSCNGGGVCHTAAFVLAWMLGESQFVLTDSITGAKWTITYKADVNMDGTYDENDSIKDKNLYCLVSPLSFSCGNMVPAMLKASERVTILGVTSGGGTSVVQSSSAADGTMFRFSSKNVMSASKNGSNYDIDQGVEPHYYISKPANFYNIEKIQELINSIK